jgi:dolichol kinase
MAKKPLHKARVSFDSKRMFRSGLRLMLIPLLAAYAAGDRAVGLVIIALPTLGILAWDLLRYQHDWLWDVTDKYLYKLLYKRENDRVYPTLSGASYLMIGTVAAMMLLPKPVFMLSMLILLMAEPMAHLADTSFGRIPFFDRTLEGVGAYMLVCLALAIFLAPMFGEEPFYYVGVGIATVLSAIIVGASRFLRISINLLLPFSFGGTLWALLVLGN